MVGSHLHFQTECDLTKKRKRQEVEEEFDEVGEGEVKKMKGTDDHTMWGLTKGVLQIGGGRP